MKPIPDPDAPVRVVIIVERALGAGRAANVAACISAGLSAALPGWAGKPLRDAAGFTSFSSSHVPVPILAGSPSQLAEMVRRLADRPDGSRVVVFPHYAQSMHTATEYWNEHERRSLESEPLLGIGVTGPSQWVRSITGSLPLLK